MMRVVIDTNVLISAAMKATSTSATVILWADAHGRILKSSSTEIEFLDAIGDPRLARFVKPQLAATLTAILERAENVDIAFPIQACRDPDDDKFLELALTGRANAIVSGDKDLLSLHPFRGIPILTPAGFLEWVASLR